MARAMPPPEPFRRHRARSFLLALTLILSVAGCTPRYVDPGPMRHPPSLGPHAYTTADGLALPYRTWAPAEGSVRAVIVALHGFNDYSRFFETAAEYLSGHGIMSYAYDQRGFGAAPFAGRWFQRGRYLDDARDFTREVAARHPDVPLYLLGESMGGAVAMSMLARDDPAWIAGAILSAPAVWGRETMPPYQTALLWLAAHTVPAIRLTGRGLDIQPSDNIEMLRALGRDPLVIKGARVDAIWGLVDLMDLALASTGDLDQPTLILYGARDEIIQAEPTALMFARLPAAAAAKRRVAVYDGGYHMLLRDLAAETVWADIAHWIENPSEPLPSGAEARAETFLDTAGRP